MTKARGFVAFGMPGDIAVVGDWNHDGHLHIGVVRNVNGYLTWYVQTGCADGTAICNFDPAYTEVFNWGLAGDFPVVGDWDHSGHLRIGIVRGGTWIVNLANCQNVVSCNGYSGQYYTFSFPNSGTGKPIVGDWGGGYLSVGAFNQGAWAAADESNLNPFANWSYGLPGDIPVMGPWTGLMLPPATFAISGQLTAGGYPFQGTTVTLSGSQSATTVTDNSGRYTFAVLAGGNYTVVPSATNMLFTPPSSSWNNVNIGQQADFTSLPADYANGSGSMSIPSSFTAPEPVLLCDDISGLWVDSDQHGNSIAWDLTQSGSTITGQMSYEAYRSGVDCGKVSYDVINGSYDGSQFLLSATIHGSATDSCGYPVVTLETETVKLSGRACGTGTANYDIVGNTAAGTSPNLNRRLSSSYSGFNFGSNGPLSAANSTVTAGESAPLAKIRPLDTKGSSNWTTVSPRFSIQYSNYIPVDHIAGPTGCLATNPAGIPSPWKTYKGDAFRGTYRSTESILVIPGSHKYGSLFTRGGPTRNYGFPSSPANGSTLSSLPTGDLWRDPYQGADEDERQSDCIRWNGKGEADRNEMGGLGVAFGNPTTVNLYGVGRDPLEPQIGGIKWNLTISLDTTDPAHPRAAVSSGTHTCYPAHIVKVNGTTIYDAQPTYNNTGYLLGCLSTPGFTIVPSPPQIVAPF